MHKAALVDPVEGSHFAAHSVNGFSLGLLISPTHLPVLHPHSRFVALLGRFPKIVDCTFQKPCCHQKTIFRYPSPMTTDSSSQPLLRFVFFDGQRVGFVFPYDPERIDEIRTLFREHRGIWNKPHRAWVIPATEASDILYALEELDPQRYPASRAETFLAKAQRHPQPFVAPDLHVQIQPLTDGRHALRSMYDPVLVAVLHRLRGSWHKPWWVVDLPLERLQRLLEKHAAIPQEFQTVLPGQWELLDSGTLRPYRPLPVKEREPEKPPTPSPTPASSDPSAVLVPALSPLTLFPVDPESLSHLAKAHALYPHQQEGLHFLLARSSALLADDMGLGKTRQALVAALALQAADPTARVLIVCPASLKRNWEAELHAVGVPSTQIARPETLAAARAADQDPEPAPFLIVNYELLRILQGTYALLLCDEAHYLKEPRAQRTQEAFRLAQRVPRRWLLTATPMLNREEELWTLLRLGGHPLGSLPLGEFRHLYAGDTEQRTLLRQRIQEWTLRRHKNEVLSLPGKYHLRVSVEPEPQWWARYRAIQQDDQLRAIEKIGRLRILLEQGKRKAILDLLDSLQDTAKALVFCQFRESVHWFAERLGDEAVALTGALSQKARDRVVRRFQEEDGIRWLIATIDVAGVGLNLTAAQYVFFASRPWTPAAQEQAEDRAYRIGQNRRVEIYLPQIAESIDDDIAALLDAKREVSEEVLGTLLSRPQAAPPEH